MPLYKSSTHSPVTDQAACKSQASTSSPEHFLGLFTWSLKLLWISWIPKLSLWVVLKLQMKKKNHKQTTTPKHYAPHTKLLYHPANKRLSTWSSGCLVPTDSSCFSLCLLPSTPRYTGGSQLWKTEHCTWIPSRDQLKLDLFRDLRVVFLPCFNRTAPWHPFWEIFQYQGCWRGKTNKNPTMHKWFHIVLI